jgi:hypothetical protein
MYNLDSTIEIMEALSGTFGWGCMDNLLSDLRALKEGRERQDDPDCYRVIFAESGVQTFVAFGICSYGSQWFARPGDIRLRTAGRHWVKVEYPVPGMLDLANGEIIVTTDRLPSKRCWGRLKSGKARSERVRSLLP